MAEQSVPEIEKVPLKKRVERAAGRLAMRLAVGPIRCLPLPLARAFGREGIADVRRDHQDDDRDDEQPERASGGRLPALPIQAPDSSITFRTSRTAANGPRGTRCRD